MYQVPGEANARETGWALRTLTALYVETNDNKWLVKCDWIIDNLRSGKKNMATGYHLTQIIQP